MKPTSEKYLDKICFNNRFLLIRFSKIIKPINAKKVNIGIFKNILEQHTLIVKCCKQMGKNLELFIVIK